jgi:hypothetical protein
LSLKLDKKGRSELIRTKVVEDATLPSLFKVWRIADAAAPADGGALTNTWVAPLLLFEVLRGEEKTVVPDAPTFTPLGVPACP